MDARETFLLDQAKASMNKGRSEFTRIYKENLGRYPIADEALMETIRELSDSAVFAVMQKPDKMDSVVTNLVAIAICTIAKYEKE
jgi:hypothetical protein